MENIDNKFEVIYDKIYDKKLETNLNKKTKKEVIILLLMWLFPLICLGLIQLLSSCFSLDKYEDVFSLISIVIWLLIIKKGRRLINSTNEYVNKFNKKIVAPLIQNILPQSEYDPYTGMTIEDYSKCEWEKFNMFESNGKITATTKLDSNKDSIDLNLYNIISKEKVSYLNDIKIISKFEGVCCFIKLPNNTKLYTKINNKYTENKESKLTLDMKQFEEEFDVETNDNIKTMQILTADVMFNIIKFVNETKIKMDIYINDDKLYLRFHTGEKLFDVNFYDKESLKRGYSNLSKISKMTEYLLNVISDME